MDRKASFNHNATGRTLSGQNAYGAVIHTLGFNPQASRQAHIGQALRAAYDDVVDMAVPDDFQALIDQLDSSS